MDSQHVDHTPPSGPMEAVIQCVVGLWVGPEAAEGGMWLETRASKVGLTISWELWGNREVLPKSKGMPHRTPFPYRDSSQTSSFGSDAPISTG